MANTIILKKSSTASAVPAAASLQPGELAVNLADKKLYSKTVGGTVILLSDGNAAGGTSVQSVTSAATVTPNADTNDLVSISAQAVGLTIAAPTGTSIDGQKMMFRIKDNGTSQTIGWNAVYVAAGATLPTATTAGKWHHLGFIYNGNTSTWMCVAATVQA